ncbi:MAG TPA: metallophosphoesterase [Thermomicrobiales bacterium]|jgi:3',5'-cyclic AMP phosphodiesterase CpdA
MTVIAHLSDPHLDGTVIRLERLRAVITSIRSLPHVDVLVVTGDVADHGRGDEYAAFRRELPQHLPAIITTGNHDTSAAFERHVGARNTQHDIGDLRIIGLDTLVEGHDEGVLDAETLAFAHDALATAPGRVLLAMHHPPVPVGHPLIDATLLTNADALAKLISPAPAITGLLTGHVHTAYSNTFAGVPVLGAPGIASTLTISEPGRISADQTAPPGYMVHTINDGRMSTRFVALAISVPPNR